MTNADAENIPNRAAKNDTTDISSVSDAELRDYCYEIVLCLRIYGKLDETTARQRLAASDICSPEHSTTDLARSLLFHEEPYYWAMEILHARAFPRWWDESSLGKLWPPPADYHHPDWPHNMLRQQEQD